MSSSDGEVRELLALGVEYWHEFTDSNKTQIPMKITINTALAITALSILVPCALLPAQDPSSKPTAEQTKPLQGLWEGVEAGREAEGKSRLTITGNSIHFQGSNTNEWYKGTFTLPAETNPKQLRATITGCPQPDFIGKVALSIFKIEDGTLTLVGHKPGAPEAPKSFDGDQTSRRFIFKKAQPQQSPTEPSNAK